MAKRNRKLGKRVATSPLTVKWIVIAVVAVSFSLSYVWQHVQLVRTGYTIKILERELREWDKANDLLTMLNERLKSPRRIERLLLEKELGLTFPLEKNIIRLRYPRYLAQQEKEASGTIGGTDTLLSFRSGGGGTVFPHI